MRIRLLTHVVCLTGGLLFAGGCGGDRSSHVTQDKSATGPAKDDHAGHADSNDENIHGHSHERGKLLIADAGPYHALLTAHLAASGNQLDIFIETPVDKDPQAVAIAIESFEAQATAGEGESQTLTFEPASPEERPDGEKPGTCSHFVAKAAWMKPDDELLVVARFTLDGTEIVARWKNFNPKKYAHHVE